MPMLTAIGGILAGLSIRRCVGGEQLACGCIVGRYETYGGKVLSIIDAREPGCRHQRHDILISKVETASSSFHQEADPASWVGEETLKE